MLKWLHYGQFPKLHYVLTGWDHVDDNQIAIGKLTFHDHTRIIKIPMDISKQQNIVKMTGYVILDYRDFGLELIRKFFLKVDPLLTIEFELIGTVK